MTALRQAEAYREYVQLKTLNPATTGAMNSSRAIKE